MVGFSDIFFTYFVGSNKKLIPGFVRVVKIQSKKIFVRIL